MKLNNQKRANTVLGLTLDNGRLEVAWLRRTNGSVEVKKVASVPLTLDLMRNETELVGQEIRNLLNAEGIRERRCVVGLPAEWMLTVQSELPDLAEEDVESYLALEAEQNFPTSLDQLQIELSRQTAEKSSFTTQLAVVLNQIERLEAILAAAQLKPVQLSPSITALSGAVPAESQGTITAVVGEDRIGLLIAAAGGIITIRSLDNVIDTEGAEKHVLSNIVNRELRITLGRLPEDLKSGIHLIRVFGAERLTSKLVTELEPAMSAIGITVQQVTSVEPPLHGLKIKGEPALSAAFGLATRFLSDGDSGLNFLPPKPTIWQQLSNRYSGKKLAYGGSFAGAAALIVCGMFVFQQFQLSGLRGEWDEMKDQVYELEDQQAQIREFRPWYDPSVTSLQVLQSVTQAFPEEGNVTARTLDIREQSTVTVTGTANSNTDFLNVLDKLRDQSSVAQLNVDQMRGESPLQFSFNFDWQGGITR